MSNDTKVFLSYSRHNEEQADAIDTDLKSKFNIEVLRDIRDIKTFGSIQDFMKKVRECDYVIKLISKAYLESESCMFEVIEFIKDDNGLLHYLDRTIPIILPDAKEGKSNIFKSSGKLYWTKYWAKKHKELSIQYKDFIEDKFDIDTDKALREVKNDLSILKTIAECISNEFITYMCNHKLVVGYYTLKKNEYIQIVEKIAPNKYHIAKIEKSVDRKEKLEELNNKYKSIRIVDSSDPDNPEFPPENPKFPATPTIKINIPNFSNVWIKDESINPTGTHKDRLAYEVIRKIYMPLLKSNIVNVKSSLPHISIISSGSAAIAIQSLLNQYRLPHLKVLTDNNTPVNIKKSLQKIGCEMYETDLSKKPLKCNEILAITNNKDGIDISSRDMLDPINYVYYDWLSYEVLNEDPEYCFIPFGTGDLFSNILNISVSEFFSNHHDNRLLIEPKHLGKCHFIAATTNKKNTKLDKLYSPFLPFSPIRRNEIEQYKSYKACGTKTTIGYIEEKYVDLALEYAKENKITCEPSGISGLGMLLQLEDIIQEKDAKILIINTGKLKLSK